MCIVLVSYLLHCSIVCQSVAWRSEIQFTDTRQSVFYLYPQYASYVDSLESEAAGAER